MASRKRPLDSDVIDLTGDSDEEQRKPQQRSTRTPGIDLTGDSDDEQQKTCPVCLEPLGLGDNGPAQALGCVHVFCRGCIAQCITAQLRTLRTPDCPVCKRPVPPGEQAACGVVAPQLAAAAGPSGVDMFDVDESEHNPAVEQRRVLTHLFPHAAPREIQRNRDPMRLLDGHLAQMRRERHGGARGGARGRGTSRGGGRQHVSRPPPSWP